MSSQIESKWLDLVFDYYQNNKNRGTVAQKKFPVFPWITPRVPFSFIDLVYSLGKSRKLSKGELLYSPGEKVNKLCIVLKGLCARSLVNPAGFEAQGIGISPPMHIASGNLNFFSNRPCCGCYYTLYDTEIVEVYTDLLRKKAFEDLALLEFLTEQFEMCSLSDRMAFACRVLVDAEDRIKAFLCSWVANFALSSDTRNSITTIETIPLPSCEFLGRVLAINPLLLENIVTNWEGEGFIRRKNDTSEFSTTLLDPIYHWITRKGSESSPIPYPESIRSLLSFVADN